MNKYHFIIAAIVFQLSLILLGPFQLVSFEASDSTMYKTYAQYYDQFYQSKDYTKEVTFLHRLLSEEKVKTILDIGCGTGTHLSKLEEYGYDCEGIDLNIEMIDIARTKLKGKVSLADMRDFDFNVQFDAIISMFAVFNHNLNMEDAQNTLTQLRKHLKLGGVLILDLYNPQSSGRKVNSYENVERIMEWQLNPENQTCDSIVKFIKEDKVCEEQFVLKIYSLPLIKELLLSAGFNSITFYDNYTVSEGTELSKNLIIVAK